MKTKFTLTLISATLSFGSLLPVLAQHTRADDVKRAERAAEPAKRASDAEVKKHNDAIDHPAPPPATNTGAGQRKDVSPPAISNASSRSSSSGTATARIVR